MSVAELCAELDSRYEQKKCDMPAERHIKQLIDKVQTKAEAEMAADAIARFHHERVAYFAQPMGGRSPVRLDGHEGKIKRLNPQSFIMFITACKRSGNLNAAVEAAERHHLLGLHLQPHVLRKLMLACTEGGDARLDLVLRVYALWQKLGWAIDDLMMASMMRAACQGGKIDTAVEWLKAFVAKEAEVHVKVYIALMEPAIDAGRADVVLEVGELMRANGKPQDNCFSLVAKAHAHLLLGDVANATACMRQALSKIEPREGDPRNTLPARVEGRFLAWPATLYREDGAGVAVTSDELRTRMAQCMDGLRGEGAIKFGAAYDVERAFIGVEGGGVMAEGSAPGAEERADVEPVEEARASEGGEEGDGADQDDGGTLNDEEMVKS